MKSSHVYTSLAFAGATPFLACALLPLFGVTVLPRLGELDALASSYGVAIICFLAGTHWAVHVLKETDIRMNLLVGSNVVFLAVWITYVAANLTWALVSQLVAFIVLLLVDRRLLVSGVISETYFRVRVLATGLAGGSLAFILLR